MKVKNLKTLRIPEKKRNIVGTLWFYSMYMKNLQVDSKPFYDLLRNDTDFKWTPEPDELFLKT